MNISELAQLSVGIIGQTALLTIGAGNKISISTRVAKESLNYQEGDVLYIDKVVKDNATFTIIACVPAGLPIKTFNFNKGTLSFGDKALTESLGGQGSEWDEEGKFDELVLEGGRICPIYSIEQKVDGKKKQKEAVERYKKAPVETENIIEPKVEEEKPKVLYSVPAEDITVDGDMTEAQIRQQEFEQEDPDQIIVDKDNVITTNFGL